MFRFFTALFLFSLISTPLYAGEVESFSNLGNVYWHAGEDVSYDYDLEDLIPIEYYDMDLETYVSPEAAKAEKFKGTENPIIAIVIDDMGVNREVSARAVENLQAITMSYLPYAKDVELQVATAKEKGHEILLHLPWEPNRATANAGPNKLLTKDTKEELQKNIAINLDKFKDYVGVNNHMGSKFSGYRPGIELVMEELKQRGKFFLDSKTIASSMAEKIAREYSIPTTHRNVFLDHIETKDFVKKALLEVESIARRTGSAVAIGHPKEITVAALEAWLPTLEAKGFKVVKLQEVITKRQVIYNSKLSKK